MYRSWLASCLPFDFHFYKNVIGGLMKRRSTAYDKNHCMVISIILAKTNGEVKYFIQFIKHTYIRNNRLIQFFLRNGQLSHNVTSVARLRCTALTDILRSNHEY